MGTHYSIGQLARLAQVPTSTLRYYERVGLLIPTGRTSSNYRFYGEEALEQLRFVRAAQATGFSLEDVGALLEIRLGSREPCREVQRLIEDRLGTVEQRLKDLKRVKKFLDSSLDKCHETQNGDHCAVIDNFSVASAGPAKTGPGR